MRRGNGEGSIIKLGGKRKRPYAVRVTVGWSEDGKQKYKYLSYHSTKSEARAALRKYLVNPYDVENIHMTMMNIYGAWEKTTKLSPTTIAGYRSAFFQCPNLHNRRIRDVKMRELEDSMYSLKPSMQGGFRNVIQHIYTYAIKHDMIDKNLGDYLTPAKSETTSKREPFTSDQIRQIRSFKHKYTDIVIVLLYTGMRINELLSIKLEDVNLEKRYMIGGLKTKAGKDRIIPIHDEIYHIVSHNYTTNKVYLFEHNNAKVVYRTFMTVYWKRLQEHLGTAQTPHCTRHSFISQADECGLNRIAIKKIVGHVTGDVTDDVYTHKNAEKLVEEVNKLKY